MQDTWLRVKDENLAGIQTDFNRRLRRLVAWRILGSDKELLSFDSAREDVARFSNRVSWSDFVSYTDIFMLLTDLGYGADSGFAYTCDTGLDTVTLPVESVRYLLLKAGEEHAEYFAQTFSEMLEDFDSAKEGE